MKCVAFFVVTLLFNQCLQINANPKRSNAAKSNKNLPDQQTDDTYPGKPIAAQDALMTINEYSKAILEAGVQLGYSIGAMDQSLLNVEEMDKVKAYIVEKMADLKDPFETHQIVNLPNSKRVALERGEKKRKPIKERLVRSASELSMVGTRKVKREVTQTIETSVPQKHENDGNVKSRSGTKNRFGLFNWFGNNLFGKIIRPYTGGYNNVGYVKPNRPNLSFTIGPFNIELEPGMEDHPVQDDLPAGFNFNNLKLESSYESAGDSGYNSQKNYENDDSVSGDDSPEIKKLGSHESSTQNDSSITSNAPSEEVTTEFYNTTETEAPQQTETSGNANDDIEIDVTASTIDDKAIQTTVGDIAEGDPTTTVASALQDHS